jgi:hypothetical protein
MSSGKVPSVTTAVIAAISVGLAAWTLLRVARRKSRPPGPLYLPVIGHLHVTIPALVKLNFHEVTYKLWRQFGNIVSVDIVSGMGVMVSDVEESKRVLSGGVADEFVRVDTLGKITPQVSSEGSIPIRSTTAYQFVSISSLQRFHVQCAVLSQIWRELAPSSKGVTECILPLPPQAGSQNLFQRGLRAVRLLGKPGEINRRVGIL